MSEIWFTSDTHFYHDNILRLAGRPFGNVEEMNQTIVWNWNKVVGPSDKVYHLGDVAFQTGTKRSELDWLLSSLRGRKTLILGNHDKLVQGSPNQLNLMDHFREICLWKVFREYDFFCSHIPLLKSEFRGTSFQVHGHLHQEQVKHQRNDGGGWDYDGQYINVCVEHTEYTPVHIEDIAQWIKENEDRS